MYVQNKKRNKFSCIESFMAQKAQILNVMKLSQIGVFSLRIFSRSPIDRISLFSLNISKLIECF